MVESCYYGEFGRYTTEYKNEIQKKKICRDSWNKEYYIWKPDDLSNFQKSKL